MISPKVDKPAKVSLLSQHWANMSHASPAQKKEMKKTKPDSKLSVKNNFGSCQKKRRKASIKKDFTIVIKLRRMVIGAESTDV